MSRWVVEFPTPCRSSSTAELWTGFAIAGSGSTMTSNAWVSAKVTATAFRPSPPPRTRCLIRRGEAASQTAFETLEMPHSSAAATDMDNQPRCTWIGTDAAGH
jgi:hypothetical protein